MLKVGPKYKIGQKVELKIKGKNVTAEIKKAYHNGLYQIKIEGRGEPVYINEASFRPV